MIERAGPHTHERTPRNSHWIRRILVTEDLRPAVLVEANCLHELTLIKLLISNC